MKPYDYEGNGNGFFAQYHRMREGPNYFLVKYKRSSVLRQDPKDAWRILGSAKFTQSAQDFKAWCLEMDEKYRANASASTNSKGDEDEGRKDTSFASEALVEESDPTANTKMVT